MKKGEATVTLGFDHIMAIRETNVVYPNAIKKFIETCWLIEINGTKKHIYEQENNKRTGKFSLFRQPVREIDCLSAATEIVGDSHTFARNVSFDQYTVKYLTEEWLDLLYVACRCLQGLYECLAVLELSDFSFMETCRKYNNSISINLAQKRAIKRVFYYKDELSCIIDLMEQQEEML